MISRSLLWKTVRYRFGLVILPQLLLVMAGREDNDAVGLVDRPVEAPLERERTPVYPGIALVEHDVAHVVFLQELCGTLASRVLQHPQRVPKRRALPPYPGRVVGLHPSVPAHREHGPARDVVEVRGCDYASSVVVLLEPRAGGNDFGWSRPVFGARARSCGFLQVQYGLSTHEGKRESDGEQGRHIGSTSTRPG